jgi:hypothetical protein
MRRARKPELHGHFLSFPVAIDLSLLLGGFPFVFDLDLHLAKRRIISMSLSVLTVFLLDPVRLGLLSAPPRKEYLFGFCRLVRF